MWIALVMVCAASMDALTSAYHHQLVCQLTHPSMYHLTKHTLSLAMNIYSSVNLQPVSEGMKMILIITLFYMYHHLKVCIHWQSLEILMKHGHCQICHL
jgi:hypothetical protein